MAAVADFTESEIWAIETARKQRWPEQSIALQMADQVHADKETMKREEMEQK